jgi:hypothetical protein
LHFPGTRKPTAEKALAESLVPRWAEHYDQGRKTSPRSLLSLPDGRHLAAGGDNGVVYFLRLSAPAP